ncbi:MAG: hypothetical protein ACQBVK_04940 [Candidatus Phytoplasma sp. TWB_XP]
MKFIGKKILCLALILNLVNFFIFMVFNVCSFSFFKKKNPYFNNNVVYAQKEENANKGNNKDQNDAKDNQLNKPKEEKQEEQKEGWGSWLSNKTKAAGSKVKEVGTAIYNTLPGTKAPENIDTQLLNQIQEEITAIEETKEQIKELTKQDETLKNMLESDEAYKKIEQQYKEVETKLKENKFQEALDLLNLSKGLLQQIQNVMKNTASRLWNLFCGVQNGETYKDLKGAYQSLLKEFKTLKDTTIQDKKELDEIRTNVLQLTNSNSTFKEILDCDAKFQEAEKQYKEIETKLQANKFQDDFNLLKPSPSLWKYIKSWFPLIGNTNPKPLKDIYQSILVDLQNTQKLQPDLDKLQNINDVQEHKSWKDAIINKINNFWPSANVDVTPTPSDLNSQEEIPAIKNFLNNHKFATKLLGWCLGEKSNDVKTIASNLTNRLAQYIGNKTEEKLKNKVEQAKKDVPQKATDAVKGYIFKVITAAVAFTSLVITFLYWFIIKKIKKIKLKNHK